MKKQLPPEMADGALTILRAHAIINLVFKEMKRGLSKPSRINEEPWISIFGKKDGVVVPLLRLVQAMAVLADYQAQKLSKAEASAAPDQSLTETEMKQLAEWFAGGDSL